MQDFVYGGVINTGMLDLLGDLHGPVLDIGCGVGAWAGALRRAGATTLVGVEPNKAAAIAARSAYDLVATDRLDCLELEDLGGQPFAHIIAADVLEHLVDPWAVLRRCHRWSREGATLAISVPNARYYRLSLGLLLAGRFTYQRSGVMDWTHLRWFTQRSLARSLEITDWVPLRWDWEISGKRMRASRLLGGKPTPLLASQLRVIARQL